MKATHETNRLEVQELTQIINVGPAIEADFKILGVTTPQKLIGRSPVDLYKKLIEKMGQFHDPCVLDVFIASIDYMNGRPPKAWWKFTEQRKAQ